MVTKKKIALFLLTAGTIGFAVGIYYFHDKIAFGQAGAHAPAEFFSSTGNTPHTESTVTWMYAGLLLGSMVMVGTGGYIAGTLKTKGKNPSVTLDFTTKTRTNNQELKVKN